MDQVYNSIKRWEIIRYPRPLSFNPKGPGVREYYGFHDGGPLYNGLSFSQSQLQKLVNRGYLQEFVLTPGQPSETKVKKGPPRSHN